MARLNRNFAERVESELDRTSFHLEIEPTIGGLTPDFVVTLPNGRQVIIETKGWAPTPTNLDRAREQARFYREQLGSSDALVVLPEAPVDRGTDEVVGIDTLVARLNQLATEAPPSSPSASIEKSKPIMFCAMPFDASYDDVYFFAMADAAAANGLAAHRVDLDDYVGDVVDQIIDLIHKSAVVVADISESNPNVMYEAGYAAALGKPVVPICFTPLDEMPFNVAQNNTIEYMVGQVKHLVPKLIKRVAAIYPP